MKTPETIAPLNEFPRVKNPRKASIYPTFKFKYPSLKFKYPTLKIKEIEHFLCRISRRFANGKLERGVLSERRRDDVFP